MSKPAIAVILASAFFIPLGFANDTKNDSDAALAGDWHGESVCVVRPSGCHDEDSLYHITPVASRPGWFSIKADKIVDGKPVTMGTVECSYQPEKKSLTCEFERGVFQFFLRGDQLQGIMDLKDGTMWRKISLKRVK